MDFLFCLLPVQGICHYPFPWAWAAFSAHLSCLIMGFLFWLLPSQITEHLPLLSTGPWLSFVFFLLLAQLMGLGSSRDSLRELTPAPTVRNFEKLKLCNKAYLLKFRVETHSLILSRISLNLVLIRAGPTVKLTI